MKLINFLFSKDALTNTTGSVVNAVFGLIFFILVSRFLGAVNFGTFAAIQAIQLVFADIFDLGTNTGILRFLPKFSKDSDDAKKILKIALIIKIVFGVVSFLIGVVLSKIFSALIFKDQNLSSSIFLSFIILPSLLLGFSVSCLQARRHFVEAAFINIATNIFRLAILVLVIIYSQVSVFSALAIFVLTPLFGFLISPFFFSFSFLTTVKSEWKLLKEFLSFNKWVTFAFSVSAIQSRIDNLLLVRLAGPLEVGLYAASSKLLSIFPLVSGSLSTAYAPAFSKNEPTGEKKKLFKTSTIQTLIFALGSLIPLILATQLIKLIYGIDFIDAVKSFRILNFAMFFVILSVPALTAIIYFFSKPQYYFLLTVIQLIVTIVGDILLIPKYGASGAAITYLAAIVIFYSTTASYTIIRFKQPK